MLPIKNTLCKSIHVGACKKGICVWVAGRYKCQKSDLHLDMIHIKKVNSIQKEEGYFFANLGLYLRYKEDKKLSKA